MGPEQSRTDPRGEYERSSVGATRTGIAPDTERGGELEVGEIGAAASCGHSRQRGTWSSRRWIGEKAGERGGYLGVGAREAGRPRLRRYSPRAVVGEMTAAPRVEMTRESARTRRKRCRPLGRWDYRVSRAWARAALPNSQRCSRASATRPPTRSGWPSSHPQRAGGGAASASRDVRDFVPDLLARRAAGRLW